MSQKNQVYHFLENLPEGTTNAEAWETFQELHPDFKKSNFDFYRNNATKEGKWTPGLKEASDVNLSKPYGVVKELVVKTVNVETIDKSRFVAIPTNTPFDKIASKRMGIMPGTSYIITGESGAGKTTICTNIADYLKEANEDYTAGFISCEMDEDDWTEEVLDNPRLGTLETVFMLDYLEASNYVDILKETLSKWKFVILDSFEVVIDQLREVKGWTAKKAESELINMLRQAASESGCTIFAIQQYTKGGTFVGSNKIKHMLTGMIFVKFDKNGDRYVTFVKNRRGGHMVGKHLYFTKNKETGRLEFDGKRFENEQAIQEFTAQELETIQEEAGLFDAEILDAAAKAQEVRERLLDIKPAIA